MYIYIHNNCILHIGIFGMANQIVDSANKYIIKYKVEKSVGPRKYDNLSAIDPYFSSLAHIEVQGLLRDSAIDLDGTHIYIHISHPHPSK